MEIRWLFLYFYSDRVFAKLTSGSLLSHRSAITLFGQCGFCAELSLVALFSILFIEVHFYFVLTHSRIASMPVIQQSVLYSTRLIKFIPTFVESQVKYYPLAKVGFALS